MFYFNSFQNETPVSELVIFDQNLDVSIISLLNISHLDDPI